MRPVPQFRFEVIGLFDECAAQRLAADLDSIGPAARVHVDFAQAKALSDQSLAQVALALSRRPRQASVSGLTRHQLRVLEYLGVATR